MDGRRPACLRILVAAAIIVLVASAVTTAEQAAVTILYAFTGGTDGAWPSALIQATDGNFYGMTNTGGGITSSACFPDCGTIFKMTSAGIVTVLHAFTGGTDGAEPYSSLIQGTDGNFYGTTEYGGASNMGTVFQMTPAGTVTVLHTFAGGTSGAYPSRVIQAIDGNFYGTTGLGGASGWGLVFTMNPAGTVTVLHEFTAGTDGANPGPLIQATDGNFYGTTGDGGGIFNCGVMDAPQDCGTVYKMTPAGTVTILHVFAGGTDGGGPVKSLIQATDGNFYGMTAYGGGVFNCGALQRPLDCGTAYQMTPAGRVTVLHAFAGGTDGGEPEAALIQATDGNFYGTTAFGGSFGLGTVFKMTPAGTVTILHSFAGGMDGAEPDASVVQATDGNLYGTTNIGGDSDNGVVFELTLARPPAITAQPQSQTVTAGRPAVFTVAATGLPAPTYQWQSTNSGSAWFNLLNASPYSGVTTATLTLSKITVGLNGAQYRCVATNGSGSTTSSAAMLTVSGVPGDFDGDGRADITVFRPSNGTWYVLQSETNYTTATAMQWGNGLDIPVPGDYDGDGQTDIAVFRPSNGTWYIVYSSTGSTVGYRWGNGLDVPVPGDYDGDGKTDIAVFRPSSGTWYIVYSSTASAIGYQWGNGLDVPVPGDYDGDGKTDLAVFRPSTGIWYIVDSSTGMAVGVQWGNGLDVPVPGDYDGDGKTDIAVFRPSDGIWYIVYSSTGSAAGFQWGNGNDVPVPADYDGDGKTDLAVFRPSNGIWYLWYSSTGTMAGFQWGNSNDVPILKRP